MIVSYWTEELTDSTRVLRYVVGREKDTGEVLYSETHFKSMDDAVLHLNERMADKL